MLILERRDELRNYTALCFAVESNRISVVRLLADKKADGNIFFGPFQERLFSLAAKNPSPHTLELVQLLIEEFKIDPLDRKSPDTRQQPTINHFIAFWKDSSPEGQRMLKELMEYILKKCIEFGPVPKGSFDTLITVAARSNNIPLVELLINNYGVDIHYRFFNRITALSTACENGLEDMARFLIKKGAKVQYEDQRCSAIVAAAKTGSLPVIKILVEECRVDIDAAEEIDNKYYTALAIAARNDYQDVVIYLLGKGAKLVPSITTFIETQTDRTADQGDSKAVDQTSVSRNARVVATETTRIPIPCSALVEASRKGNEEIVKLLLENKADVNYQDPANYLRTPLHAAICEDEFDIAVLLIAAGANLNIQDKNGKTVLHQAAHCSKGSDDKLITIFNTIPKDRFNLDKCDKDGNTPLHLAAKLKNEKVLLFWLKNFSCNLNARNNEGKTLARLILDNTANKEILHYVMNSNVERDLIVETEGSPPVFRKENKNPTAQSFWNIREVGHHIFQMESVVHTIEGYVGTIGSDKQQNLPMLRS